MTLREIAGQLERLHERTLAAARNGHPPSGSAEITRSAFSGCAKKNQWYQSRGKFPVGAFKVLQDRQAVDDDQLSYNVRMIHRHSKGGIGAAIVADGVEGLMAELSPELDQRCCIFALRRMTAVIGIRRDVGSAKPRHIRADNAKEWRSATRPQVICVRG